MEAKVAKSNQIGNDLIKKLSYIDFYVPARED